MKHGTVPTLSPDFACFCGARDFDVRLIESTCGAERRGCVRIECKNCGCIRISTPFRILEPLSEEEEEND